MAVQVYWTEDFKVRSLIPKCVDSNGLQSPFNILTAGAKEMSFSSANTDKGLLISVPTGSAAKLKLEFSTDGSTYNAGSFLVDVVAEGGTYHVPLEGVRKIRITNTESGTVSVNFLVFSTQ